MPYWYPSWRERVLASRKPIAMALTSAPRILFTVTETAVELSFGVTLSRRESEVFKFLLPEFEAGDSAEAGAEDYGYTPTARLLSMFKTDEALRKCVQRLRRRLGAYHADRYGTEIEEGAVIQTLLWQGYRLNPALVRVLPSKLRAS
jgi:hypothetical protein